MRLQIAIALFFYCLYVAFPPRYYTKNVPLFTCEIFRNENFRNSYYIKIKIVIFAKKLETKFYAR